MSDMRQMGDCRRGREVSDELSCNHGDELKHIGHSLKDSTDAIPHAAVCRFICP